MTNILVKNCGKHKHTDGGITLRLIDIIPNKGDLND